MKRWLLLLVIVLAVPARPSCAAQETVQYDIPSLLRVVQPLRHSLGGRLPLRLWCLPDLHEPDLEGQIQALAARGIVPTVTLWGDQLKAEEILPLAKAIQGAGQPVEVLLPGMPGDVAHSQDLPYLDSPKVLGPSPYDKEGNLTWKGEQEWPILPIYNVSKCREFMTKWMRIFKDAGVTVDAVWMDYEGLPNAFNFAYEAQKGSAAAKHYPPGVLDSFDSFAVYLGTLRNKVLGDAIVDPVHEIFPEALVSNYSEAPSSREYPFVDTNGAPYAPRELGTLNVAMPSLYANTVHLPRYYNMDWPVTQEDADRVYFTLLLRSGSASLANKRPGKLEVPYVSRFCPDSPEPRYLFGMSQGVYREFLRHLFWRGADGLYLFNLGYPGSPVSAALSFESVEDARSVLDEMLEYREFLEQGKPMNFGLPAMRTTGIVWSGLALGDKALVRTFCFGPGKKTLDLVPWPGVGVKLEATNRGATYVVHRSGKVTRVKVGLG